MIGYAVRQGPIYAGQKSDGSFGYQDNYSPEAWLASESFVQNVSRNISASGQLTWNTPAVSYTHLDVYKRQTHHMPPVITRK